MSSSQKLNVPCFQSVGLSRVARETMPPRSSVSRPRPPWRLAHLSTGVLLACSIVSLPGPVVAGGDEKAAFESNGWPTDDWMRHDLHDHVARPGQRSVIEVRRAPCSDCSIQSIARHPSRLLPSCCYRSRVHLRRASMRPLPEASWHAADVANLAAELRQVRAGGVEEDEDTGYLSSQSTFLSSRDRGSSEALGSGCALTCGFHLVRYQIVWTGAVVV